MKKILFILTLSFYLNQQHASAQTLKLDSIAFFPDTVTGTQSVNMDLFISNSGGFIFNGDLIVFMHSLNDTSGADTLYYDSTYSISGNTFYDTINITHVFNAAELDAGDNIVVVWPASSQMPLVVNNDSLTFNIYYSDLGIGEDRKSSSILLFPNPSQNGIRMLTEKPQNIERVRIFDALGNEILRHEGVLLWIDVRDFAKGLYFLEVLNKDGSIAVKKFFKE